MIEPLQSDDALLNDIRGDQNVADRFRIWWFGQSGFLVQWNGHHLLFDPYLSDSLTRKYADTDKPHVRISRRVVDPAKLDFIDVVTSSHNHTDHLDGETLSPLLSANPSLTVVVPEANLAFAADRLQVEPKRLAALDAGQEKEFGPFRIRAVPAAHETVDRDEQGRCRYLGYVARFGHWSIYHSGDTMLYPGMVEAVRDAGPIDVALLPINGRRPERRVAGNLWGRDAAQLAHDIQAKVAIPCHYDLFAFNTESPREFVDGARSLQQPVRVLQLGERFEWPELG